MKKIIIILFCVFLFSNAQAHWPTTADQSKTNTTNFGGNLSSTDNTVQKVADTLDDIALGGDTTETNQDDAWKAVSDGTGTETFIGVTYQDATNDVDFVVPVLDEDDMATDSAAHLATQQSIKAYVDTEIAASGSQLTEEEVEDFVGGMLGGTETLITVTYQDATGDIDFVIDDAELTALSGLTSAANSIPIFTGSGTADLVVAPANSQSLLAAANYAAMKALLNLEIGTDVQAQHAQLQDIADDTYAQGDLIYYDGSNLVNLGPGVSGQYLQTQGAAANPQWASAGISGDIEDVGDVSSGAAFTADGAGNTLYFEGSTANAFEVILTADDATADVTATLTLDTGNIVIAAANFTTDGALARIDIDSAEYASVEEATGLVSTGNDLAITGDLTVTGDDIFATTNTSGAVWVGDGTNYNPVVMSGDAAIASGGVTTIQANAVALATDTTGNFVATVADAGNSNITVANSGAENAAVTLDVVDVTCTDCLNATEIEDLYVLLAGDTVAGNMVWNGTQTFAGAITLNTTISSISTADEFQAAASNNIVFQMGDAVGGNKVSFQDSGGTEVWSINSDGAMSQAATDDGFWYFDPATANESEWWLGPNHDSVGDDNDNFEIRQSATPGSSVEFYIQPDGDGFIAGDLTITGDDLFMTTNTDTAILIADGTNFNVMVPSGDVSITNAAVTTVTDLTISSEAQGDILYFNGSNWVRLGAGNDGEYLETNGAAANPSWSAVTASAGGADTNIQYNSSGNLGGEAAFLYVAASNLMTVENIVSTAANSYHAFGADPADAGELRFSNADTIMFEASAAGTDVQALSVDASEVVQIGAAGASGVTITPATTITGTLSLGTNPASTGTVALPHDGSVYFRNFGNDGDLLALSTDGAGNDLIFLGEDGGTITVESTMLLTVATAVVDMANQAAIDWDMADNLASSVSFDAPGLAGIFNIRTSNGTEGISTSGTFTATGAISTTGLLSGGVVTNSKAANYTVGTDNAAECYGGIIYVTSTCDITACDNLAAGMSFSVITIGATQVDVDVQADDLMNLDGTALNDGEKAANTTTAGDIITFYYYDATGWYAISGGTDGDRWTNGG